MNNQWWIWYHLIFWDAFFLIWLLSTPRIPSGIKSTLLHHVFRTDKYASGDWEGIGYCCLLSNKHLDINATICNGQFIRKRSCFCGDESVLDAITVFNRAFGSSVEVPQGNLLRPLLYYDLYERLPLRFLYKTTDDITTTLVQIFLN